MDCLFIGFFHFCHRWVLGDRSERTSIRRLCCLAIISIWFELVGVTSVVVHIYCLELGDLVNQDVKLAYDVREAVTVNIVVGVDSVVPDIVASCIEVSAGHIGACNINLIF